MRRNEGQRKGKAKQGADAQRFERRSKGEEQNRVEMQRRSNEWQLGATARRGKAEKCKGKEQTFSVV